MPKTQSFQQVRQHVARLDMQSIVYQVGSVQARAGDIVLGLANTATEPNQAVEVWGGCLSEQIFNASSAQVEKWCALLLHSKNSAIYLHSLSYDSVLAFVLLLLRCKTKHLDIALLQPWVDAANDSKQGLFSRIGKPGHSMYWLINALGHGFLEAPDGVPNATHFAKGFLKTVDLLLAGLERDAPVHDVLDKLGNYPVLLEALAFNRLASQRYEKVVATCYVPH